ncbi:hypothetical protein ACFORG_08485 [Lutimaribacter marinistellae]|uniref:Tetratricopeptide repeat-containing protein n=1 Tax=Lutimaribacter marinistellae TaxID=1820329 RepID=A0ABV7TE07_9RHOB
MSVEQGNTRTSDDDAQKNATQIDPQRIRRALKAVLQSPEFDGASRIQAFLQYVVDEYLAGRGDEIRSKTIAEDVYGRTLAQGDDPLAIVRVDAGRLRRRLTAYYDHAGSTDPLRIHVDPGGYCPRFEEQTQPPAVDIPPLAPTQPAIYVPVRRIWVVAAFLIGAAFAAGITSLFVSRSPEPATSFTVATPGNSDEVREALFRLSPARLQASNLAADARELMFPALDRSRLLAALALLEHAILLDPDYFGGHAGAAQIRAILALTATSQTDREALLTQAHHSASRAVALAPSDGWAHSAYALTAYVANDCASALSRSEQARRLGPDDVHVHNFDALIALFCGEIEQALDTAKTWVNDRRSSERLGFGNTIVAAHFFLGQYEAGVEAAFEAIRSGGPVSPLNVAFMAACYSELGKQSSAEESLALLDRAWPGYPLEVIVRSLFVDPALEDRLMDTLTRAGWGSSKRK